MKNLDRAARGRPARSHALLEERERLFRDLHDHVLQALYAIALELEDCQRRCSPEVAIHLSRVRRRLSHVIGDARSYISGTERPALNAGDFRAELVDFVRAVAPEAAARFDLRVSARAVSRLTRSEAEHVLHIAREALSNVLRHSQATSGRLVLSSTPRAVRLEVRDEGVGFAAEAADREQGGLRNMISRASEMGAHLQITSAAGSGTIVVLRLPKIESYRK